MSAQIRTPEHPAWGAFIERLSGPEACAFKADGSWTCDHTLTMSRRILEDMASTDAPLDVEATLNFFDSNGGHCDCEILFNVDP